MKPRRRRITKASSDADAPGKLTREIVRGQSRAEGKKKYVSCAVCTDDVVVDARTARAICGRCTAGGATFAKIDAAGKELAQ